MAHARERLGAVDVPRSRYLELLADAVTAASAGAEELCPVQQAGRVDAGADVGEGVGGAGPPELVDVVEE